MRAVRLSLAILVAVLLSACGSDSDETTEGPGTNVRAVDFSFEPATINVQAGSDVVINFTNEGSNPHSFTAPQAGIELDAPPDETLSDSFSLPSNLESIEFFCKYHSSRMRGTITVEGAAGGGGETTPGVPQGESDDGYDY